MVKVILFTIGLLFTIISIDFSFELISMSNTIANCVGATLLPVILYIALETKLFTKFYKNNKNNKNEENEENF